MTCDENRRKASMPLGFVILLLIMTTCHQQAVARSVKPCAYWCPVLEDVAEIGRSSRDDAQWALSFLRAVAENQPLTIDEATARRLAVDKTRLEHAPFFDMEIRAAAFLLIATLPSEFVLPYLLSVTPDHFTNDGERTYIYRFVRISIQKVNMLMESTGEEKERFLRDLISRRSDDEWFGWVQLWAMEELCDRGARGYFPQIDERLRLMHNTRREEILQYCQERMTVVNSHSDRSTALRGVLTVENARSNERLVHWAIAELKKLRTEEAKAAVTSYLDQLEAIPGRSPLGREVRNVLTSYGRALVPPRPVEAK